MTGSSLNGLEWEFWIAKVFYSFVFCLYYFSWVSIISSSLSWSVDVSMHGWMVLFNWTQRNSHLVRTTYDRFSPFATKRIIHTYVYSFPTWNLFLSCFRLYFFKIFIYDVRIIIATVERLFVPPLKEQWLRFTQKILKEKIFYSSPLAIHMTWSVKPN